MSSSRKKIILHIGLHKTGTTTIQNVLHANRDLLLAEEGILYPSLAPNLSTPLFTIFENNPQNRTKNKRAGLTTKTIATARREEYLSSLETEVSSREWNTLLLSAEGVSLLSAPEITRLREWGEKYSSDWTVLVCVRHPLDWTRSVVQQRLKPGDTLRQLYEELPTPNYRAKISNAISVFGKENVRVFDFEGALEAEGGIVGNFADLVGLSAPSRELLVSKAVRDNVSLSMESARILNSLNRQRPLFDGDVRASLRAGPRHELPYFRRIKGRKFDVPEAVKEQVQLQNKKDVAWLNETFGLDLYRDVVDFSPQAKSREEAAAEELAKEPPAQHAFSDPAIESIAEVLGELMTENAFRSTLERGRVALERGKHLERAAGLLREAARLDPDAPQPKKLLEEIAAKQQRQERPKRSADVREQSRTKAVGKAGKISSRLIARLRRLEKKARRAIWTR